MSAFHGDFPWVVAGCGDLDITGHRRPQSYYREIVFGLRADPYIAVLRPEHHGQPVGHASPWSWSDVVSSWSWGGHEGKPVTVEVYADADEVELLVNGRSLGRQPAGPTTGSRPCSRPSTSPATWRPWPGEAMRRSGAPACVPPPARSGWRPEPTGPRSGRSRRPRVRRADAGRRGRHGRDLRRPLGDRRGRGAGHAPGPGQRPTGPRGALHRVRAARPSTAGPSRSSGPRERERSPSGSPPTASTPRSCTSRPGELGAAVAPLPGGVGPLHRPPG